MAPRIHTHYDNLKVARDAPMEVIHAAYRSLAAMYHPNRNGDSEEAARIMRIIDNSYAALCDPVRKRDHDRWIAEGDSPVTPPPPPHIEPSAPKAVPLPIVRKPFGRSSVAWIAGVIITVAFLGALVSSIPPTQTPPTTANMHSPDQTTAGNAPDQTAAYETALPPRVAVLEPPPLVERLVYIRPPLAPNGEPWPNTSGYLAGFEIENAAGGSTATIRNHQTDDDMLVKLFDHASGRVVRTFFLRAREDFVLENLDPGQYDIRYENLRSGDDRESQPFLLTQHEERHPEPGGIQVNQISTTFDLTLYTVVFGNTRSKAINRERFLGNQ